jgi:hypothetical protein
VATLTSPIFPRPTVRSDSNCFSPMALSSLAKPGRWRGSPRRRGHERRDCCP